METPRLTQPLIDQAMAYVDEREENDDQMVELGGMWFFPAVGIPRFLPLPNHHPDPGKQIQFDYDDIEYSIGEAFGLTRGQICTFHTHPATTGQPSRQDLQMFEDFEKHMDGHPYWRMTGRHFVFSQWDMSWWWFDIVQWGRVGWKWPEA